MGTETERGKSDSTSIDSFVSEARELEAQIAWHYEQIKILKAKRNAIVPIRRLPNELMTRIFTIFAVDSDSPLSEALFSLKWTKIMKVCQHWYSLALAAQHLWAFIDLKWSSSNSRRLLAQLERSGAAPLTIKLNLRSYSNHYASYVVGHSARIRELEFAGEAKYIFAFIATLPHSDFTSLSSLSLDASSHLDQLPNEIGRSLPSVLLEGRLPHLQSLSLDSINLPWTALRGLTSLSLTRCADSSQSNPSTFAGLLDMLAASPLLRYLKLHRICPAPIPEQFYPTIDLPELASLTLQDPENRCQALIEHLHFPLHASLNLFPHGLHSGADIRDILVPIRRRLRSPGVPAPLLLKLYRTREAQCATSFHNTTTPPDLLSRLNMECPLSMNCHPSTEHNLRQMLTKLIKAVPSNFITHLDGRETYSMRPATWHTVIRLLPSLETIHLLSNRGAVSCITALQQIALMDSDRRRTFPELHRLHIIVFRLDSGDNAVTDTLTALEEFFQLEPAVGTFLKTVEFVDSQDVLCDGGPLDAKLQHMFALTKADIIVNGEIYDPIQREKELAQFREEQKAFALKYGLEYSYPGDD
ncbi:F-box domain-containing protein [Favolaschia claudopus]|uniref:F-box domain-containing protein n=1 Tax=Favolaschia claudopus TaxID=2862362 RepID=A0AAW0DQ39_9AGAR